MTREVTPKEAAAQLRRFRFATVATEFVDVAAPGIVTALREAAPYSKSDVGSHKHMRDSFRYARTSSTDSVLLTVTNTAPQTRFVLHGTRAHDVFPKASGFLVGGDHPLVFFWEKVGKVVASFGWHGLPFGFAEIPAHAPNRFNTRAWAEVREPVARELGRLAAERLLDTP